MTFDKASMPLREYLRSAAHQTAGGWQCEVFIFSVHVFKIMRSYEETLAIVKQENQNGNPAEKVARYLHDAVEPSIELIENSPDLRRLTANFEKISEGVYLQDICQPFGSLVRQAVKQQDFEAVRQHFIKLVSFIETLWQLGVQECSWKFNKNYGLNQNGDVVLMDCLELTDNPKRIQRQLNAQKWRLKNERFFNLIRSDVREEIQQMLSKHLTFEKYQRIHRGQNVQ
jgi:hypothetical protein